MRLPKIETWGLISQTLKRIDPKLQHLALPIVVKDQIYNLALEFEDDIQYLEEEYQDKLVSRRYAFYQDIEDAVRENG